ncbi:MAG: hypothetical protein V1900_02550 [Candidatus Aenigmatarchaeota archaeon]
MNSVFDRYKKMQEKFRLPQLDELEKRFKLDLVEEGEIFDQIRLEISEKLFNFSEKIIEPIVMGSDSLCGMFEQDMITTEERDRLFELYKKIQVLKWENNILAIRPNEAETARWIRKTWNFWDSELEVELSRICKKLSFSWESLELENKKTDYHG